MKVQTLADKPPRLEIRQYFKDSRSIDLELVLNRMGEERAWSIDEISRNLMKIECEVIGPEGSQGRVVLTHGLEPPTRATLDNKQTDGSYVAESRQNVLKVAAAFLEECAGRGLVAEYQKDKAVAELNRHDKVEV